MNPLIIICYIKTIFISIYRGGLISGHNFKTIKEKTPPNVHILECSLCGKTSFGYSWDSLENSK